MGLGVGWLRIKLSLFTDVGLSVRPAAGAWRYGGGNGAGFSCLCLHPLGSPMAPTLAPWCEGQDMSGPGLGSDSLPPWSILRVGGPQLLRASGEGGCSICRVTGLPSGRESLVWLCPSGVGRVSSAAGA